MQLPERPASLCEAAVAAWSEAVVIDTYELPPGARRVQDDATSSSAVTTCQLLLGLALRASGEEAEARDWLVRAARRQGDLDAAALDGPYWQALALRELGRDDEAAARLRAMRTAARQRATTDVRIPYFATSLPTMLLFDDDLTRRARLEARYVEGLAQLGLGRRRAARACFEEVLVARPDDLEAALRIRELDAR